MNALTKKLESLLHHRSGIVRKTSIFFLRAPKRLALVAARPDDYLRRPPALANSFPKSGTHLLDQIVAGLPGRENYGAFIASLTSSFQMRSRTTEETVALIRRSVPGELVRGHMFYDPAFEAALQERNFAPYFISRDLRDVVVSGAHYLRTMNPWHRLHKYFKDCSTVEEAILLQIQGLTDRDPAIPFPSLAERFAPYEGWLSSPAACAIRFEDLRGDRLQASLERIVDFYIARSDEPIDRAATLARLAAGIAPEKSHTFRKGKKGGWQEAFTPACREAFKKVAGDLLIRLGYETNYSW